MPRNDRPFQYRDNALACDGVPLSDIAAEFGTPLFVYSAGTIRRNFRRIAKAFAAARPLVAYSTKANTNGAILRLLAAEGAGFDIVSGGELDRVRRAGVGGDRIIFAGVGKTVAEMRQALKAGVLEFNLESAAEAERLNDVAASMKRIAPVAIRVNPDVDARTHKFISTGRKENKFGLWLEDAAQLAQRIRDLPNLRLEGLHAHIGSQILDAEPHRNAVAVLDEFINGLASEGIEVHTLNFGGGFGIAYEPGQKALDLKAVAREVVGLVKRHNLKLILEPGRSIVGPAGALLTRVEFIKPGHDRTFAVIDAAMTELIRPALYQAYHEILNVDRRRGKTALMDIVGPVCESADFLAQKREMIAPRPGDLLAALDAGAYGFVMASNYNSRPKPAEVLVDGGQAHLIRRRETARDLTKHEVVPEHLQ
ncbi:diaminopimelate decarboxylase [bacterium]|nr:diaminopimelate decarboxylase [bacterium]